VRVSALRLDRASVAAAAQLSAVVQLPLACRRSGTLLLPSAHAALARWRHVRAWPCLSASPPCTGKHDWTALPAAALPRCVCAVHTHLARHLLAHGHNAIGSGSGLVTGVCCMCWLHAVLCGALVTEIEMRNRAVQRLCVCGCQRAARRRPPCSAAPAHVANSGVGVSVCGVCHARRGAGSCGGLEASRAAPWRCDCLYPM
jgi:hypothetical protein